MSNQSAVKAILIGEYIALNPHITKGKNLNSMFLESSFGNGWLTLIGPRLPQIKTIGYGGICTKKQLSKGTGDWAKRVDVIGDSTLGRRE